MPENRVTRSLLRMMGGAVIGAAVIWVLDTTRALHAIAMWRPEEIASTVLGGMLMMVALITGGFSTSRPGYRALTDEGLGEPVTDKMLSTLRRQAVITGMLGLMMVVPPAAVHAGYAGAAATLPLVVLGLLTLATVWIHIGLWRESDELTRAVSRESGYASFVSAGTALFAWAVLEKLALVPAIDSWMTMTAMMAISLVVSMFVAFRRGLVGR